MIRVVLWWFNLYVDGVVKQMSMKVLGRDHSLISREERVWDLSHLLFADDTVEVTKSGGGVQVCVGGGN